MGFGLVQLFYLCAPQPPPCESPTNGAPAIHLHLSRSGKSSLSRETRLPLPGKIPVNIQPFMIPNKASFCSNFRL